MLYRQGLATSMQQQRTFESSLFNNIAVSVLDEILLLRGLNFSNSWVFRGHFLQQIFVSGA